MIGLATTQQTDGRHTRLLTEDPTISLQVRRGLVVELAGKQITVRSYMIRNIRPKMPLNSLSKWI